MLHAQECRRKALLAQLSSLRFILQQGLAIRGHGTDIQGNLQQLLRMMAGDSNAWLREKYMSTEIVNEQVTLMGQSVLRMLLTNIKKATPCWYAVIADEVTDVANREQFNLSLRWVNDKYPGADLGGALGAEAPPLFKKSNLSFGVLESEGATIFTTNLDSSHL